MYIHGTLPLIDVLRLIIDHDLLNGAILAAELVPHEQLFICDALGDANYVQQPVLDDTEAQQAFDFLLVNDCFLIAFWRANLFAAVPPAGKPFLLLGAAHFTKLETFVASLVILTFTFLQ